MTRGVLHIFFFCANLPVPVETTRKWEAANKLVFVGSQVIPVIQKENCLLEKITRGDSQADRGVCVLARSSGAAAQLTEAGVYTAKSGAESAAEVSGFVRGLF